MSYVHPYWSCLVEPMLLILILGLLVKTFASSSKKIEQYTREMCASTHKAQVFLRDVDHEFDLMNSCAKSVKTVFLNFGKAYRDVSHGTKTVEEAIHDAKSSLPEEIFRNLSQLFAVPVRGSNTDARDSSSSVGFDTSRSRGSYAGDGDLGSSPSLTSEAVSATEESDSSAVAAVAHQQAKA